MKKPKKEANHGFKAKKPTVRLQWIKGFLVVLGIFLVLGGLKAFAQCKADPMFDRTSVIRVTSRPIQPTYYHDHSTRQIEAMRHQKLHLRNMHEPGLTLAEHELKTDFRIGGMRRSDSRRVCVWLESVNVDFSFTKMDVFISSQYGEGSCPYQVIRDHENQHVAINLGALKEYRDKMERALKGDLSLPTKADPLSVSSLGQAKKILASRIKGIVDNLYSGFKREVLEGNARIDTLENYRRTQAKCQKW